jgi:sugar (pentulose or hexulose) kinase
VKLGTADTSSAMLAAGMRPGDVLHSVGTTQVLGALVDRPTPDPRRLTRLFGVGDVYCHVAHNPVGGAALNWLHDLCYRDQTADVFFGRTVPAALARESPVLLDPPFLGGDRLEIEARRAAFRELTLATERDDLLAAVLAGMRTGHRAAFAALGVGERITGRVFLTGGGADLVRALLPEYADADLRQVDEGGLRGVARLFVP